MLSITHIGRCRVVLVQPEYRPGRTSVTSKPLRGAPSCERGEDPVAATLLTSVRPCDVERADIKHRTTAEEGAYNIK